MKKYGFSLIELLITLFIVMILLAFFIPSEAIFYSKARDEVMSSQLLRALNLARSAAVTRGEIITLCKSNNQKTCAGDWQDGYIIYTDNKILYSFHNSVNKGVLRWRAFPKHADDIQYLPSGMLRIENGTFWYCQKGIKKPRWAIVINMSGRARVVYPDKMGNIEVNLEKELNC